MQEPKGCENQIGPRVKRLGHSINRRFMELARQNGIDEVTVISGRIMGLIHYNPDRDIFQKDVEDAFCINRSSVTSVVQLMEKKGYIIRQPVPYDARLKKLVLTEKGVAVHEHVREAMLKTEDIITAGISPEERRTFINLCDRMIASAETWEAEGDNI